MSPSASKPPFPALRFIPASGQSSPGTRRIATHACDNCRRKKKRCIHASDDPLTPPVVSTSECAQNSIASAASMASSSVDLHETISTSRPSKRPRISDATCRSSTLTHVRFTGDLNPDVELLSGSTNDGPLRNNVGVWHSDNSREMRSTDSCDIFSPSSLFHVAQPRARTHLAPLLEELQSSMRPPIIHFQAMEKFYFQSIHPLLPAVDQEIYYISRADGPARILQEQIICILASLNPSMAEHLHLENHDQLLSPAEFARKIVGSMRLTLECAIVSDKTIVIRAFVAMSLITYGPESIDLTSQYFVRAVHLGYTIGIHLPQDQARDERVAELFCYIWSIDRLHAAVQGRPIFMHEIDMGKHVRDHLGLQSPGFQVLVHIAVLLDKTIALYRPGAQEREITDSAYPTFEEIITECQALDLPPNLLSTLELFYHGVGILSCRKKGGSPSQGYLARNARQTSSALQISEIMEQKSIETLVLLPFVPYAVSLALSAAYRDYKHCKAANHRSRARRRLVQVNQHLSSLGKVFWSAALMSELATKILLNTEGEVSETSQEPTLSHSRVRSGLEHDTPTAMEVTFGHEWNPEDMDQFFADSLDPSLPWDVEGFLAFPSLENSGV